jgi:site-specific recombinase XerD
MAVNDGAIDALLQDSSVGGRLIGLSDAAESFLRNRRVGNCTARTLGNYAYNLNRFVGAAPPDLAACTPAVVQQYLTALNERLKPISVHQHYRTLKTFFAWCVEVGLMPEDPMRTLKMKLPKTLPRVPDDEAVRRLLDACPHTFEGSRNKALIALLADSGLRISEALRLRIEDLNFMAFMLLVRGGKGGKDGIGYFGHEAARIIRGWLKVRGGTNPGDYLFADRDGRPLSRSHGTHILHRLSVRAGLDRKVGPHALRHYAATSILKQTGDLELVRRVLRHESLAMTIRYTHLASSDISAKFRSASPLNGLRAGR